MVCGFYRVSSNSGPSIGNVGHHSHDEVDENVINMWLNEFGHDLEETGATNKELDNMLSSISLNDM